MIVYWAATLVATLEQHSPPSTKTECEVGAAALADLPLLDRMSNGPTRFYDGQSPMILQCPNLRAKAPPSITAATSAEDEAVADSTGSGSGRRVVIYRIGIPVLTAHNTEATMRISYRCAGLCGGVWELSYVRQGGHWKQKSPPKLVAVA
jgi:hypothetical protein